MPVQPKPEGHETPRSGRLGSVLVFERDLKTYAVGFDLAVGDHYVLLR